MTVAEGLALFLLASIATAIECLVRYAGFRGWVRWGPRTWLHITINGVVAVGVLALLRTYGLEVGSNSELATRSAQVAGAGFVALAVLRSASFARRIQTEVELPEQLTSVSGVVESARHLLSFLVNRADQEMRERFDSFLTQQAQPLLNGWTYVDHGVHIGAMCQELAVIEEAESALFAERLKGIDNLDLPDQAKALLLIRMCVRFTGQQTAKTAIETIVQ